MAVATIGRDRLSLRVEAALELSLKHPDLNRCLQANRLQPLLIHVDLNPVAPRRYWPAA